MTDFRKIRGFEDLWRHQTLKSQKPTTILSALQSGERARLERLVSKAPQVLFSVTGRPHTIHDLRAHLNYISREAELPLEDRDGALAETRAEIEEKAQSWELSARSDRRRRDNTPLSHLMVLSMPAGADPEKVLDAARSTIGTLFGENHDYLFVLHTDTLNPHVHLAVRSRGDDGRRLEAWIPDLNRWRSVFAQELRDRGVAAEAIPRSDRGVTLKSEHQTLRRLRELYENQGAPMARVMRQAYREAAAAAFQGDVEPTDWERKIAERHAKLRARYSEQASLLMQSPNAEDHVLGAKVQAFLETMPKPDSRRLVLARELRAANRALPEPASEKDRGRDR